MSAPTRAPAAAVGFTVKSGWASVVLLQAPDGEPAIADARRLELCDPSTPEARQPYHAGFGTARSSGHALDQLVASVQNYATRAAIALFASYRARYTIAGAGLVVGSLIDPDTLTNPHIRIHALEGRLFRQSIESGAQQSQIATTTWRERDLYAHASSLLKRPEAALRTRVTALGRTVQGGWRAEHKAAALAAWLVLHSPHHGRNG